MTKRTLGGWIVAGTVSLALAAPATAQERPLVFVDPGHGGEQAGVVTDDGIQEKDMVLRWGFLVAEAFARAGYEVRMTRTGDAGPGFAERVRAAEEAGAAVFLSLHMNGDDDPTVWGTEIFLAEDRPASVAVAEAVGATFERSGAEVRLIPQPWEVLKSEAVPTVMIELGHLTHPVERRLLLSRDYQEEAADLLVESLRDVLGTPGR